MRVLRDSGKYQRVLESSSSAAGDYLLLGKLYEFGEVDSASIQTKISLMVELVDRKTNQNVWDHLVEREEPVSGKTVADVVQSLDRNLQRVVSETAVEIDKFLATRRLSKKYGIPQDGAHALSRNATHFWNVHQQAWWRRCAPPCAIGHRD